MTTHAPITKREEAVVAPERTRGGPAFLPNVDIIENGEELLLIADMPGARPEDLDIQYENGLLTIHGRVMPRQDEEKTEWLLREYGVGDYHRTFEIGEGVNAAKITAEMKDGVLMLHLPKTEQARPRKIAVRTA